MECMDVNVIASMDSGIVIISLCFINALLDHVLPNHIYKICHTVLYIYPIFMFALCK